MNPKSESFWLAVGLISLAHVVAIAIIIALLVIPWRSNFMVFQMPEKKAAPVISIPESAPTQSAMRFKHYDPTATVPTPAPL